MNEKIRFLVQSMRCRESFKFAKVLLVLLLMASAIQARPNDRPETFTLKFTNTAIIDVLKNIEKNSDYVFLYSSSLKSALQEKVSLNVKNASIRELMNRVLGGTALRYRIDQRQITITRTEHAQPTQQHPTLKVTGVVTDENGETLIGVSIQEVGTNNIVVTDADGHFTMYNIASASSVLKFTYVGFKEAQVRIGQNRNLTVKMESDVHSLDETVVVGYAQQKRESVIGAITTVRPSTLIGNQTRSLSNALAGRIAGVIGVQRSGEPGADDSDFWIRGISTFGANKNPLVIVDGVERSLSNISPEEIESFSVLKDATATAVYGVRGANGVILIETKKGQIGKPRVTFKADYGVSEPTKLPDFVDAPKYMEVINDAYILAGQNPIYSQDRINKTRAGVDPDLYPNTDWLHMLTEKRSPVMHASGEINGGTERIRYSLIFAMMAEQGMFKTDKNTSYNPKERMYKYNIRSNVDVNVTPSTLVSVSAGGYITNRTRPGVSITTIFDRLLETPVNAYPAVYSNGQFAGIPSRYNPWVDATQSGYVRQYDSSLQSSISIKQDIGKIIEPLKGLSAKVLFSFDAFSTNSANRTKTPMMYRATGRDAEGNLITSVAYEGQEFLSFSQTNGSNRTMYLEGRLNYNRSFGKHTVNGLLTSSIRDYNNGSTTNSELALPYRYAGIAGRAAYSYDDRYFIEYNFGYNGSENFKRGYRFGFFPSYAIGWMVTNEKFMQPLAKVLSELKLRASYGKVGNDKISSDRRFGYLSTVDSYNGYHFGSSGEITYTGYEEGDFGIPNLTWEKSTKTDVGVEIGLFNWINFQFDYFHETRSDIFMQRKTIPEIAGFVVMPYANFGKVRNEGFDMSLDMTKNFGKSWMVSAKATLTYAANKVLEYDEPDSYKKTSLAQTGRPLNQHFGYIVERLYRESDFSDPVNGVLRPGLPVSTLGIVKPGDIMYKDLNEDGKIDSWDRTAIGKPYVPQTVYGFGFNVRYKNFDMGAFFQGTGVFTNMLHGDQFIPGTGGGALGNIYSNVDDRWTPENPSSDVFWPRLTNSRDTKNSEYSTWWIRNSSYLRLKNLEFGYTLPKSWQRACAMRNARIFFRGSNLFTWAKFKMWDPELGSQTGFKYPLKKIYSVGFEVTF